MNVSEQGNDSRTRAFNILLVVWYSLFLLTGLFFPVITVVPISPVSALLTTAFFVVGGTMLFLAFLMLILMSSGIIVPPASEQKDTPWPVQLLLVFIWAGILASGIVIKTANRAHTHNSFWQMTTLIILFMLPFVLAFVLQLITRRFSSDYASKVELWGYPSAMLIDIGIWCYISGRSPLFIFKAPIFGLFLIGCIIYLVIRHKRRNARS